MLLVSEAARWTVNAFASGYCRETTREGELKENPADNVYTTLMQGLEAFAGTMQTGMLEDDKANWAQDPRNGRWYKTTAPQLTVKQNPLKSEWWKDMEPEGPLTTLPPGHPLKGR